MGKIQIVIGDQDLMVRHAIRELLNQEDGLAVAGEASDSGDVLVKVKELQPDVVLLESTLPMFTDFDTIRLIHASVAKTRVIVMASRLNLPNVRKLLQCGGSGHVLKTAPFFELVAAIKNSSKAKFYLSSEIKTAIIENFLAQSEENPTHNRYDLLTSREKEVFQILISGHTINEVAEILDISPKTVAKHRASLMEKLQIYNVASLVRYAVKIGVIAN